MELFRKHIDAIRSPFANFEKQSR